MPELKLYIYPTSAGFKEILIFPNGTRLQLGPFGIVNAFFKVLPKNDYKYCLESENKVFGAFSSQFNLEENIISHRMLDPSKPPLWKLAILKLQKDGHLEQPLTFDPLWGEQKKTRPASFYEGKNVFFEGIAIILAMHLWLEPTGIGRPGRKGRKTPSQKYSGLWGEDFTYIDIESIVSYYVKKNELAANATEPTKDFNNTKWTLYPYYAMDKRTDQFTTRIAAITPTEMIKSYDGTRRHTQEKKVTAELYTSRNGLLPLLWAEIQHAIKNDVYVRDCLYCKNWFPISRGKQSHKFNQKYCALKCRRAAEKEANSKNKIYKEIKKLQMRRTRAKKQEDKDILTKEIERLVKEG